jgi:hypothetical protein
MTDDKAQYVVKQLSLCVSPEDSFRARAESVEREER